MPNSFFKIAEQLDIAPLRDALLAKPHLFGEKPIRGEVEGSPHAQMKDIWVRYNDDTMPELTGDYSGFSDEHDSVWYQRVLEIPEVFPLVFHLMHLVQGERLGGILITKLPAGGRIEKHVDEGWHAGYYHKFFIPIVNKPGALFRFQDGDIDPQEGQAWYFDNSVPHWVENNSDSDRIALIVCIKTHAQSMNEQLKVWESRLDLADQELDAFRDLTLEQLAKRAIETNCKGRELEVEHHFADNLYSKEIRIPRGVFLASHSHTYSHLSFLAKGRVIVKTDEGEAKIYSAGACINIAAGVNHGVLALEDAVWFCTHATNETDVKKVDQALIQGG